MHRNHVHQCACGLFFACDRDPEACGASQLICEACEADLYWNARAPEDVADEQQELEQTDYRCADKAQQVLEF